MKPSTINVAPHANNVNPAPRVRKPGGQSVKLPSNDVIAATQGKQAEPVVQAPPKLHEQAPFQHEGLGRRRIDGGDDVGEEGPSSCPKAGAFAPSHQRHRQTSHVDVHLRVGLASSTLGVCAHLPRAEPAPKPGPQALVGLRHEGQTKGPHHALEPKEEASKPGEIRGGDDDRCGNAQDSTPSSRPPEGALRTDTEAPSSRPPEGALQADTEAKSDLKQPGSPISVPPRTSSVLPASASQRATHAATPGAQPFSLTNVKLRRHQRHPAARGACGKPSKK